ncbi:Uncharacterized protein HZ326_1918 [Fusarium oxysporum f. sp. albedinis]|nr:Uncharacterized protein HZ326_1918 [Fusarium oxysporum f. sp. albedinis]
MASDGRGSLQIVSCSAVFTSHVLISHLDLTDASRVKRDSIRYSPTTLDAPGVLISSQTPLTPPIPTHPSLWEQENLRP